MGPGWYHELVEAWFRSLARRGRSRKTERTYRYAVRGFGRWLEHCRIEAPEHLIAEVIHSWQDTLGERDFSLHTQAVHANAIRGLLRWGAREKLGVAPGLWEHVDPVQRPEDEPRALEPDELRRILAHYAPPLRSLEHLRDRALFLFLLTTGSRITAALSLNRDQVAAGPLVVTKKGGGEHTLIPSALARQWVAEYLRHRGRDDQPALWIRAGRRGRFRLSSDGANGIWRVLTEQLRVRPFTNHALRHTAATELGEHGVSDTELSQHLGWKSNAMAMRYRKLRTERRQQLVDQLDDLVPALPADPAPRRRRPRPTIVRRRTKG